MVDFSQYHIYQRAVRFTDRLMLSCAALLSHRGGPVKASCPVRLDLWRLLSTELWLRQSELTLPVRGDHCSRLNPPASPSHLLYSLMLISVSGCATLISETAHMIQKLENVILNCYFSEYLLNTGCMRAASILSSIICYLLPQQSSL